MIRIRRTSILLLALAVTLVWATTTLANSSAGLETTTPPTERHPDIAHGEEWSRAQSDAWTAEKYHQVTDEYSEDWDLGGAMQDMTVWFRIGVELAYSNAWPEWNEGTEFKAIRDATLGR